MNGLLPKQRALRLGLFHHMMIFTETGLPLNTVTIRRQESIYLPEACLRDLCVCLTSDETPESSESSDQCARREKRN